jgi:hypothetical protein
VLVSKSFSFLSCQLLGFALIGVVFCFRVGGGLVARYRMEVL